MKTFGNWKDSIRFLIPCSSWVFYTLALLRLLPGSYGLDEQLWYLGIVEAAWLSCAIVFLFGCISWWEQKKTLQKATWVTKWGCVLSGGFLFHPVLGFLYFCFVKIVKT